MERSLASPEQRTFALRELVDMIIDQLAEDGNSLKHCSLVSRQWVPRCRRHLLKVISFADSLPGQSLERWCATFGVTNAAAAGLARELHFRQDKVLWIHPVNLLRHMPHLSHFANVTTLVFTNLIATVFHAISPANCFKPFVTSVRTLRLCRPVARPRSLMQIVLLFPAAVNVQISFPRWSVSDENLTLHPHLEEETEFTGILHLRGFEEKWSEFFALLSTCRLRFQKIRLMGCKFNTSTQLQALLESVSQTASAVQLVGVWKQHIYSSITLHPFNVLECFAFKMTDDGISGAKLARLLDSISSPRFSLLALDVGNRERRRADRGDTQTKRVFREMRALDRSLHRLANRTLQRTGKILTLILLANDPAAIAGSFVEFRKVGNIWKGEKLIGSRYDYYWTFTAAKDCEDQTADDSVLRFINI